MQAFDVPSGAARSLHDINARSPIFEPTPEDIASSHLTAFIAHVSRVVGRSFASHEAFHRFSVEEPDRFWRLLLDWLNIDVEGERTPVLTGGACETARFFPGLRLSFTRNLLRSASEGDDDLPAVVSVVESGTRRELSRRELATEVLAVASALARRGVGVGDRVVAIGRSEEHTVVA